MNDDTISRKSVIDAVHTAMYGFICGAEDGDEMTDADKLVLSINKAVCNAIKALPSVQSQRWIPVTEALPKNGHYYLKCTKYGNVDVDYYWDGFENATKYGEEIVAWMEKPKPYKGGQDE